MTSPGGRAAARVAAKAVARRLARLERGRSKARPILAPGLCLSAPCRGYWTKVLMRGGGTAHNLPSMAIELERKFLVTGEGWRRQVQAPGQRYRQGYLAKGDVTVRIRIRGHDEGASLTIKSRRRGIMRLEFEYAIPVADAETLLRKLAPHSLVEKTRFKLRYRGHAWSVDEFRGRHAGLVLAEIELPHPCALFDVPDWVGEDVTSEERYSNSFLAQAGPTKAQAEQLPLPFAADIMDARRALTS